MQIGILENTAVAEVLQNGFASHTRAHAEHLAKDYIIKNPEKVADFIGENLFLLELLEEIPNRIFQYFGRNQSFKLELTRSPEFPESAELWVFILTQLPAKESLPVFDKFNEEWWYENSDSANGKLAVTIKHI